MGWPASWQAATAQVHIVWPLLKLASRAAFPLACGQPAWLDGLVNLSMSAVLCQGINISQKFDYIAFLGKLKIFSRTLKLIHGQFFILPKIPAGNLYSHIHTNLFYPREWCFLHELLLVIAALRGLLPPLCINTDCYNNLESLRLLRSSVVYQERHSSFSKWLVIQQFYCTFTVKKVYLQIVM